MERKRRRKEGREHRWSARGILGYVGGIAGLVVTVALAWFFPGWYSSWQDGQLAGQVTLQSREDIQFLNTDFLDIVSSMKLLKNYGNEMDYTYAIEIVGNEEVEVLRKWKTLLEQWKEAGLLPLDQVPGDLREVLEAGGADGELLNIYPMDHPGNLRVVVVRILDPRVTAVIDMEKDMIYYLSVSGTREVYDWMAGEMGYASIQALYRAYEQNGAAVFRNAPEQPEGDFAAVCQALSWSWQPGQAEGIFARDEGINGTIQLNYETLEAEGFRRLIMTDAGPGVAVMYGTEHWLDRILRMLGEMEGYYPEMEINFDEWMNDFALLE